MEIWARALARDGNHNDNDENADGKFHETGGSHRDDDDDDKDADDD